jgi:hypothetical protein
MKASRKIFILLISAMLFQSLTSRIVAQITAVRTSERPMIDGTIEDLWHQSLKIDSFQQIEPTILAAPTVKTEVYVLYDQENIYIAMKMYQRRNTVRASRGRKDSDVSLEGDYVTVSVDPLFNGNTAFYFTINPENIVRDGTFDEYGFESTQWDATFTSATAILDDYWTAELQIPLTSISFQDKDVQDWGIQFYRRYAQNQEITVSRLIDPKGPYRLTNYERLAGLTGLNKKSDILITPYVYSHNDADYLGHSSIVKGKAGGEMRYTPNSSMTILATINPDYAQLETDKEVINVTDLPTEYPEKRPFFTESSEFYTNAAVYTRKIVDIKAGVQLKQLGELLKYDVTTVLDGNDDLWAMGHLIAGDNSSYLTELTTGLKRQKDRDDYNITTHLVKWYFGKKLMFSNWIGTINSPARDMNEWETVNNIRWRELTLTAGLWNQYKTKFYNPNILGWTYLSNEVHTIGYLRYSIPNASEFFRLIYLDANLDVYGLAAPFGSSYSILTLTSKYTLRMNESLGNWIVTLAYRPAIEQKFRYRQFAGNVNQEVFEDTFSKFVLVNDKADGYAFNIQTDNSKSIGLTLDYNNYHVRQSKANNYSSEVYWKIDADAMIKYSVGYIAIDGSDYQAKYQRFINRVQAEYNITDRLNIRVIAQPDIEKMPNNDDYIGNVAAYNLTLSWEYVPGSFLYFVYNRYSNSFDMGSDPRSYVNHNQSLVLKINKTFGL